MWLEKIRQYKKFLFGFFGIIFLGLIIAFFSSRSTNPPEEEAVPAEKTFRLITTDPKLFPEFFYGPSLQVTLTFEEPVSLERLSYSISPEVEMTVKPFLGGRQMTLRPREFWPEGTYTLIISKKTTSSASKSLDQDYSYQFKVGFDPSGAD